MAPAVSAGPRQAARLRSSSRTGLGKTAISAAADLVVKPSTPPWGDSTGTSPAVAAGLSSEAFKASAMNSTAAQARAAARVSHGRNGTEMPGSGNELVGKMPSLGVEEIPSSVRVEEIPSSVRVEVRSFSGEPFLVADFALSDRVLSVKERVQEVRKIPLWQQMITLQGEMLNDNSRLQELNLRFEEAVFEIVIRAGPSVEDMENIAVAKESIAVGKDALQTIHKRDIAEVKALKIPPQACHDVCLAALHMLAGHMDGIPVKRNGSPKNTDWNGCKVMLDNRRLVEHLLELPDHIDNGTTCPERMAAMDRVIHNLDGDTDAEKLRMVGRCSLMCQRLLQYLICVSNYHKNMSELSERFGGAAIKELMAKC